MQRVTFDPTIIINHDLNILDPNSITVTVYLIYLDIMRCYQFTAYIHLLVVLVVLIDLCLLSVLYLHVVLVVLVDLCVMFWSLILTLTIRNQQMFHQYRTLNYFITHPLRSLVQQLLQQHYNN